MNILALKKYILPMGCGFPLYNSDMQKYNHYFILFKVQLICISYSLSLNL